MKNYYLANKYGEIEKITLSSDKEAFDLAVKRNRLDDSNWKAYDERGNLIYNVCIIR